MAETRFCETSHMPFGEIVAKQSQDDKPLTHQRLVRTASVNDALWSRSSLRSRRGMKVSATWPQLSTLSFASLIRVRPFGLPRRFDEAPSSSGCPYRAPSRWKNLANPAKATPRYHFSRPLASRVDKAYLSRSRRPREGCRPVSQRRHQNLGVPTKCSEVFARSGPLPSLSSPPKSGEGSL